MDKRLIKIITIAGVIIMIAVFLFAFIVSRKPGAKSKDTTGGGTFPTAGESGGGKPRDFDESSSAGYKPTKIGALTQLTKVAVSGAAIYGTTTALYMEKSTGHIYKIGLDGSNLARVSNTTIPKTFEAMWSPKGDKLAVRYFDEPLSRETRLSIKSFLADIGKLLKNTNATTSEMTGVALPSSVTEMAVSPAEDKVFYLSLSGDTTSGIVADFKNKSQKKIFEMPFGEFNVSWPIKDTITLMTKPSAKVNGYLYFLNEKTGNLNRILAGIKGLTASVSPAGDKIIYSENTKNGAETKIYDIKKETTATFGIMTLPEKCAWGKKDKKFIYCAVPTGRQAVPDRILSGDYPDLWYQGVVGFNDSVWTKNLTTGETQLLSKKFGADIVNLIISEDDNYLVFNDKAGGALWSLKLK